MQTHCKNVLRIIAKSINVNIGCEFLIYFYLVPKVSGGCDSRIGGDLRFFGLSVRLGAGSLSSLPVFVFFVCHLFRGDHPYFSRKYSRKEQGGNRQT